MSSEMSVRKSVPGGSATARFHVVDSHDVNHAQNRQWFASEASARQYACDRSVETMATYDVCRGAAILASFRDGKELL
jgi:hypothetical protein